MKTEKVCEEITFEQCDTYPAVSTLVNVHQDLKENWESYIQQKYGDYQSERVDFIDIEVISRHIWIRLVEGNTHDFPLFFDTLEDILNNCSIGTENLLVIGLIEDVQNLCRVKKIDHWKRFDQWLKPTTKKKWDFVARLCEGWKVYGLNSYD